MSIYSSRWPVSLKDPLSKGVRRTVKQIQMRIAVGAGAGSDKTPHTLV